MRLTTTTFLLSTLAFFPALFAAPAVLPQIPSDCSRHVVTTGETCSSIAKLHNVGTSNLLNWNSALNKQCTNLIIGDIICIITGNNGLGGVKIQTSTSSSSSTVAKSSSTSKSSTSVSSSSKSSTSSSSSTVAKSSSTSKSSTSVSSSSKSSTSSSSSTVAKSSSTSTSSTSVTSSSSVTVSLSVSNTASTSSSVTTSSSSSASTVSSFSTATTTSSTSTALTASSSTTLSDTASSSSTLVSSTSSDAISTTSTTLTSSSSSTTASTSSSSSSTLDSSTSSNATSSTSTTLTSSSSSTTASTSSSSSSTLVSSTLSNVTTSASSTSTMTSSGNNSSSLSSTITSSGNSTTSGSSSSSQPSTSSTTSNNVTDNSSTTYTVVAGDSCYSIMMATGINATAFFAFNPLLNATVCSLTVGEVLCLQAPNCPGSYTPPSNATSVVVAAGQTCSNITATFGISQANLFAFNPSLDNVTCKLTVGQTICLQAPLCPGSYTPPSNATSYTVVAGDTCSEIAANTGISASTLKKLNPSLGTSCALVVGQVLCLQAANCIESQPYYIRQNMTTYVVQPGDYCWNVSNTLGIPLSQLDALNPGLGSSCTLYVGATLCLIAPNCTASATLPATVTTYRVQAGDYCELISAKINVPLSDIIAFNPVVGPSCIITAGQLLCMTELDCLPQQPSTFPNRMGSTMKSTSTSVPVTNFTAAMPGYITSGSYNGSVSWSFDDGPFKYEQALQSYLTSVSAEGSFFVNGNNEDCIYTDANIASLRSTYAAGSLIASHTWSHYDITAFNNSVLGAQLDMVELALWRILGVKPALFRPPYGSYTQSNIDYLNSRGYTVVGWDVDTEDALGATVTYSIDAALLASSGSMILGHEIIHTTVTKVVPAVIPQLQAQGLQFVTVANQLNIQPYQVTGGVQQVKDSTWTCTGTPSSGEGYVGSPISGDKNTSARRRRADNERKRREGLGHVE